MTLLENERYPVDSALVWPIGGTPHQKPVGRLGGPVTNALAAIEHPRQFEEPEQSPTQLASSQRKVSGRLRCAGPLLFIYDGQRGSLPLNRLSINLSSISELALASLPRKVAFSQTSNTCKYIDRPET